MYTRTKIRETFYGLQATARHRRQRQLRRHHKIAERLARTAAYTAAKLMQFAESEILGIVDYYRIDIRHVYAAFDYGCRQQHVVVVGGKSIDCSLEFLGRHLPMADGYAGIRHQTAYHSLKLIQAFYAVVHEKDLAVARQFEIDGFGNNVVAQRIDRSYDRITVRGRRVYRRKVAGTHQRELQSTGNRRGTHGQSVDIHLHLLQFFLDCDPEFLLFVDHKQAQILEFHIFAYELVGTDNNVDFAVGKVGEYSLGILGRTGAREVVHPHRKIMQTV